MSDETDSTDGDRRRLYNSSNFDDILVILAHIESFTSSIGISNAEVDSHIVKEVVSAMRRKFPHSDGLANASPFKKAARFLCVFVELKPVKSPIPNELEDLAGRDINAIVGVDIAISALKDSILHCDDGSERVLSNPIDISAHTYVDLVEMVEEISDAKHFKVMALLLEQIAYKTNPACQYNNMVYGGKPLED